MHMDSTSTDAIDPPANVLLLCDSTLESSSCIDLITTVPAIDRAELQITFAHDTRSGENRMDSSPPHRLGVISVGDILRSTATKGTDSDGSPRIRVDTVDDPRDLPAISTTISECCEEWASVDEQIVVCFRSLDGLLKRTSLMRVFHFTHIVTKRLASVDALAHFHLDPSNHPDAVIQTLRTIFDEVVEDENASAERPEASDEEIAAILGIDDPIPTIEETGQSNREDEPDEETGDESPADDDPSTAESPETPLPAEATDDEIRQTFDSS